MNVGRGMKKERTELSAPTEMSEHLRRAACPHAAVMVRWLTGGGLRAARPTEAYLAVRRGGALPLPRATARVAPTGGYKGCSKTGRRGRRPLRKRYMGCGVRDDVGIVPYGSVSWGARADSMVDGEVGPYGGYKKERTELSAPTGF